MNFLISGMGKIMDLEIRRVCEVTLASWFGEK